VSTVQIDGQKDKGLDLPTGDVWVCHQRLLTTGKRRNLVVGELKQEGAGLPAPGLDPVAIDGAKIAPKAFEADKEVFYRVAQIGGLFAGIAKRGKKMVSRFGQWDVGEGVKRLLNS